MGGMESGSTYFALNLMWQRPEKKAATIPLAEVG
jgi:hypothetical protein